MNIQQGSIQWYVFVWYSVLCIIIIPLFKGGKKAGYNGVLMWSPSVLHSKGTHTAGDRPSVAYAGEPME